MESGGQVGVIGCKHTTLELIRGLRRGGVAIAHAITIDPAEGQRQKVAGYLDLRPPLAKAGIPCTVVETYSLRGEADRHALLALPLDALLVQGWQRLIPAWLLEHLRVGAFGMHGSSRPLPHGRGRSPLNWSLIQGKTIFYTHLFRYAAGVDNGPVVGVQRFDINAFDTCLTLHLKNTLAMTRLCLAHLPDMLAGRARLTPQPTEGVSYYPKRSAEDGLIYWTDGVADICNLVRAVTRPFPGAFAFLNDDRTKKVYIWRAQPFDTQLTFEGARPGDVVESFSDGMFLVQAGDGALLVTESEAPSQTRIEPGDTLGHLDQPRRVWEDLPA